MNESTEHPLHETLLHDVLHAHVRESGGEATGPYLAGLADGALRVARRRQRLARVGVGLVAAAMVATVGVAVANGATQHARLAQPAAGGTGNNTAEPALISLLPITSSTERPCAPGTGGYAVSAIATRPALCIHVDRGRGMTDVHVASAKAEKSDIAGMWQIDVTFDSADRSRFAALTGSLATAPLPRNQFAVAIDGKLWDVPAVASSITDGRLYIGGAFTGELTSATAHDLALRLNTGS